MRGCFWGDIVLPVRPFPCHLPGHQQWDLDMTNCYQPRVFTQEHTLATTLNPKSGLVDPISSAENCELALARGDCWQSPHRPLYDSSVL